MIEIKITLREEEGYWYASIEGVEAGGDTPSEAIDDLIWNYYKLDDKILLS